MQGSTWRQKTNKLPAHDHGQQCELHKASCSSCWCCSQSRLNARTLSNACSVSRGEARGTHRQGGVGYVLVGARGPLKGVLLWVPLHCRYGVLCTSTQRAECRSQAAQISGSHAWLELAVSKPLARHSAQHRPGLMSNVDGDKPCTTGSCGSLQCMQAARSDSMRSAKHGPVLLAARGISHQGTPVWRCTHPLDDLC